MPRIFKYGEILNITFTPDEELNILIYRSPSYLIIYRSHTLLKMVRFFWPTLYSVVANRISYHFRDIKANNGGCERRKLSMGCPLPIRLGGLWERRQLPLQRGPGQKAQPETSFGVFWRPQNDPFCTYMLILWAIWCLKFWNMTKSEEGQFALAYSHSKFWGGACLSLTPWSTPMKTIALRAVKTGHSWGLWATL